MLSFSEQLSVVAALTNVLLPLGIIGIAATLSKRIGVTVFASFPFIFFAAFQIVLLLLYGGGIISVDMFLNLLTTNDTEVEELLGRMLLDLLVVFTLYIPLLAAGCFCIVRRCFLPADFLSRNRKIFSGVMVLGVIGLCGCYRFDSEYSAKQDLYPVNIGYNLYLTKIRNDQTRNYLETSAGYKFNVRATHDAGQEETYVVVIGETSRAYSWELFGYKRPTNPLLSKRDDLIIAGKAYSESNTTHKSVPMLLSVVNAQSYDGELYKVKSLITAFREAGFHTAFLSNQMPNHSYIDYFGSEADTTIFVKLRDGADGCATDDVLLGYVDQCLKSRYKKQLIVVHTYGSHFNYRERYSDRDRVFLPDDYSEASLQSRPEMLNAYDNSIIATDRFLNSIICMMERRKGVSAMFYTSDHGEDIFEDGKRFLHASPAPSENQLHVPLIAWLSDEYVGGYPGACRTLKENFRKHISTSRSFCPTIISVGGIVSEKVNSSDDVAAPDYKEKDLYYLDDHNEPLKFLAVGK